jgi:hypothetical protein
MDRGTRSAQRPHLRLTTTQANGGDRHDGEHPPYRLPAISSRDAPIDRFTLSLLIVFKAIRVR